LLGLGEESSSDDDNEAELIDLHKIAETPITDSPKRKPLNFSKVYSKKFPDYTKSPESKAKILEN
jgi:hypothetical protein